MIQDFYTHTLRPEKSDPIQLTFLNSKILTDKGRPTNSTHSIALAYVFTLCDPVTLTFDLLT